jgi:hypothetical protein
LGRRWTFASNAPRRRVRRYSTPLNAVWSRQHKLELEWRVELALLQALGEVGRIPSAAHPAIKAIIDSEDRAGSDPGAGGGGGQVVSVRTCRGVSPPPPGVAAGGKVTLARTLEIEKDTHHDIMAMVKAISEQSAEFGGYVHLGATSQDINDTVLALQMTECKASGRAASRQTCWVRPPPPLPPPRVRADGPAGGVRRGDRSPDAPVGRVP